MQLTAGTKFYLDRHFHGVISYKVKLTYNLNIAKYNTCK